MQHYVCYLEADSFHFYLLLTDEPFQEVAEAKYLGCTFSDNLEWTKLIQNITAKGNSKLAFLRRILRGCLEKLKEIAYFSLAR